MKNIVVVGCGTMGNGIAHLFAQNNYDVYLNDISDEYLQKALKIISNNLDRQIKKGEITEEQKNSTLTNIKATTNLESALQNPDLVIEAVSENINLKKDIFNKVDKISPPKTIIASNTSSISITELAQSTKRAEKVIGMHFMNPVPVIKLIEVIRGKSTSDETCKIIMDLSKSLNKTPVEVNDFPGFVTNRILIPMLNEAIYCVMQKVAEPEAIDTVMKLGMNHPMGPLTLADYIGLDVCLSIMNVLYEGFKDPKYLPCPLLLEMVANGNLGRKTGKGFFNYN
ncbi:MAG: 3-hydroxybutyryl-CoA dehydrogenase [Bacteroidetes bacterium]|nr:3-hydroxybutyryl-CoA dehydrogenase [Bacteroidota bacterium]